MPLEQTRALPGRWRAYQDVSIAEAITRFLERFGLCPEAAVVNISYRLTDAESLAMRENDVQLLQLVSVHGVYLGQVPE